MHQSIFENSPFYSMKSQSGWTNKQKKKIATTFPAIECANKVPKLFGIDRNPVKVKATVNVYLLEISTFMKLKIIFSNNTIYRPKLYDLVLIISWQITLKYLATYCTILQRLKINIKCCFTITFKVFVSFHTTWNLSRKEALSYFYQSLSLTLIYILLKT